MDGMERLITMRSEEAFGVSFSVQKNSGNT